MKTNNQNNLTNSNSNSNPANTNSHSNLINLLLSMDINPTPLDHELETAINQTYSQFQETINKYNNLNGID